MGPYHQCPRNCPCIRDRRADRLPVSRRQDVVRRAGGPPLNIAIALHGGDVAHFRTIGCRLRGRGHLATSPGSWRASSALGMTICGHLYPKKVSSLPRKCQPRVRYAHRHDAYSLGLKLPGMRRQHAAASRVAGAFMSYKALRAVPCRDGTPLSARRIIPWQRYPR
jgi:hypothetical protein